MKYASDSRKPISLHPRIAIPCYGFKRKNLLEAGRTKYLRIALVLVGLIFIVGIYPLTII